LTARGYNLTTTTDGGRWQSKIRGRKLTMVLEGAHEGEAVPRAHRRRRVWPGEQACWARGPANRPTVVPRVPVPDARCLSESPCGDQRLALAPSRQAASTMGRPQLWSSTWRKH